ncbi:hypothetical protein [Mycolicibacterium bacteremicum]|uniref:hypothetical protein n=1 Tax=Mycolicibacterium bacteremicum TaxID=564198 RepID=UPI0026F15FF3|nr:hypothetical protein [Mycolicibacterium bacteremicum]
MTRRALRLTLLPLTVVAVLLFVLTSCPSNRDGMPGRLATAKEETQSAAQSAALAIDLWQRGRSSRQLVDVQLSDARDEVAKSYGGISVLRAEDPADLHRQTLLIQVMTDIVATLNRSHAAVRGLPGSGAPTDLRSDLLAAADQLERDYR